jgi:hypothetical protein
MGVNLSRTMATAVLALAGSCALACPTDSQPRAPGVLLTVQGASAGTQALDASDLARLPVTSLTQRQQV